MKAIVRLSLIGALLVLANFALPGCGDDENNPVNPPPGGGADVVINIVGQLGSNSYSPNPATVTVGQTVSWKNNDSMQHTATANGGEFDTGTLNPGQTSAPDSMNTAGSFPYICSIHPTTMSGTLVVNP